MGRMIGGFRKLYGAAKRGAVNTGRGIDKYNNWVEENQKKSIKRRGTALKLENISLRLERIKAEREKLRRRRGPFF